MLKTHFTFHKQSIRILKNKKYKAWRGANEVIAEYSLPAMYHIDHFAKEVERLKQMAKLMNPDFNPMDELKKEFGKDDVSMPTQKNQDKDKDVQTKTTESLEEKFVIPGFTDKGKDKENVPKKPLIMEMEPEKYTPNFKINRFNENG